jgi:hypothetical protein
VHALERLKKAHGRAVSWDDLATVVVGLGMAMATMPSLMVSNPPLITYSDVALLVGFAMLLPRMLAGRVYASPLYLIGALCLLCISLIWLALAPYSVQVQGILRLTYAVVVLPCAIMLWRPSVGRIAVLAGFYVAGTTISVLYGAAYGHPADGRNLGLTLHPNGLGHTAMLAVALLPFLVRVLPAARFAALFAGVVCTYGIWISGSRGSLIALTLVALVYVLRERSATAALFAWGGFTVLVLVWQRLVSDTSNNVLSRVAGGGSSSDATGQRLLALHDSLHEIHEHPLLGNGFGTIRAAQDAYVQIFAALGIFGLIGFILVLTALALPLFTAKEPIRLLAYAAVGYAVLAPFTDSTSDTLVWAALSLCMGARDSPEAGQVTGAANSSALAVNASGSTASRATSSSPRR